MNWHFRLVLLLEQLQPQQVKVEYFQSFFCFHFVAINKSR